MQGAVFFPEGSAMIFSLGTPSISSLIFFARSGAAMIIISFTNSIFLRRSTVICNMDWSPIILRSCLGREFRLKGQNRVPLPPAMMTQYSFGIFFIQSCLGYSSNTSSRSQFARISRVSGDTRNGSAGWNGMALPYVYRLFPSLS